MTRGGAGAAGDDDNLEARIEKQMGCMTGFLHLIDRHHILSGKRLFPSAIPGSTSPSERCDCPSSPESRPPPSSPARFSAFEFEGTKTPWKLREAPRFSLDSRLRSDSGGEGRLRRSPSVVARLMGLDALPPSAAAESKPPELRRSVSESRVPRDPAHRRFLDAGFPKKHFPDKPIPGEARVTRDAKKPLPLPHSQKLPPPPSIQRKSFFDAEDIFPEPKRSSGGSTALCGEIERRLRMRGIDEPAKDLESLKQILEALQLKGLLHPSSPSHHSRNLIFDPNPNLNLRRAPIVLMKPSASPPSSPSSPSTRRRSHINAEPSRNSHPQRGVSAAHSPRRVGSDPTTVRSPRNRKPSINRIRSPAEDDTAVSTATPSHELNLQVRSREGEEYNNGSGRSLLERCDKLLSSIAAIATTAGADQATAAAEQQQPSPVSVLDASSCFLGVGEGSPSPSPSPSPVSATAKRAIDFVRDKLAPYWEEDQWSRETQTVGSDPGEGGVESDDQEDYIYVAEIVRASDRLRGPSDAYALLEKRRQWPPSTRPRRRLLFDAVAEILDRMRRRHASPWDAFARAGAPLPPSAPRSLVRHVWGEVRRMREPVAAAGGGEDVDEVTCGAIRRDVADDVAWARPSAELSDAVLRIERLIFKDLVADTIRCLADVASLPRAHLPRRRLVFP
ncbi:protein LONGIFOLIA 1 isoform X2 [Ananas comosus]|uniref:Protein LONGIFOLIA 1 isoform X2 n=1 Tax=Ananas comosus TaxID=4615 RepID=A0A6P5FXK0_ANACO|nr:protein LONGIFOLIA 1 isoform X2 [Ananas comosus]